MQDGSLAEDTWEREKEDEWMRQECSEYCVRPERGSIRRTQRC